MTRQSVPSWSLGLIMLGALTLRLLLFAQLTPEPRKFSFYDSDGYERRALNLLRYRTFASEPAPPLTPDLDRTPVYPALLAGTFALFGRAPQPMILLQLLLGSLTAGLAYLLARELELPPPAGLLAAAIVAADPLSIMTANQLLTETLFTTLLVLGIWLLARFWRRGTLPALAASGLILGLVALTRPISQVLPLALLPLFALAAGRRSRRVFLTGGLLFAALSLTLTYSWAIRNYRAAGIFTLSTISDTNLIYYRARAVLAAAEGANQEATWRELEAAIERQASEQRLTPAEKIGLQRRQALAILRQHPALTVKMTLAGAARILFDPGYTVVCTMLDPHTTAFDCFPGKASMNEPGLVGTALERLGGMSSLQLLTLSWSSALLGLVYVAALGGTVRLLRERRWLALALLLVLLAYFVGLSAGAEGNSRFRIPIVPFVAILAGVGLEPWSQHLRSRRGWRQHRAAGVTDPGTPLSRSSAWRGNDQHV